VKPRGGTSKRSADVSGNRDQFDRRRFLHAGGAGLVGLGASELAGFPQGNVSAKPLSLVNTGGPAKSVIIVFLYGAPSQMDTLDPKPNAPSDRRSPFKPISTSLPSITATELLPDTAKNLHRVALVRSMTHSSNNHAVSVALSGLSKSEPAIEANGADPRHQPYFGSVLEYLWKRQGISFDATGIPVNMVLPWPLNNRTDPGRWQHHAAWLGKSYNPVMPVFSGKGSLEKGAPTVGGLSRFDPWDGMTPESTFRFPGADLPSEISASRFSGRKKLLAQLEVKRGQYGPAGNVFEQYRNLAYSTITNQKVARALDVTKELTRVREKFGYTLFGQSLLTARRLAEVGVKVTTVFWDTWVNNNAAWDTHTNHHPRLKDGLCPQFDQIFPALLDDLQERRMLDDTLVMVISEHGRTPTITTTQPGGAREHWSGAYWGMFFGAGIKTGQVIGATDKEGGYPVQRPIDPKDILATAYHLLGFDAHKTTIPGPLGEPVPLIPHGEVVQELLS